MTDEYTMRRRALHRAEPMGVRRRRVGLWVGLALSSLLAVLVCLWATLQVALMLGQFLMGQVGR